MKAMRDFNNAKFADDEHTVIEGIITDVFTHESHKKSRKLSKDPETGAANWSESDYSNMSDIIE